MRVAAVQFRPTRGDKAGSLRRLVTLAAGAARWAGGPNDPGLDLLVLPEMAATGYVFSGPDEVRPLAEDLSPGGESETARALAPVARGARTWLVVGLPERAGDRLFNSALVLDRAGEVRFVYRKTLLFEADEAWATPGDSGYGVFEDAGASFTVGICMDLNDDAFIAHCAAAQTRAVALPTNWLDQGEEVWSYWAWRMRGVPSALVAANTYGEDRGTRFRGESAILDGRRVLAAAARDGDAALAATLPETPPETGPSDAAS